MISSYKRETRRQQREQAKRDAAYNRHLYKIEQERVRQIKQHEMSQRRAEREREKEEREKERELQRTIKNIEQSRFENEIANIEYDNYLWTNIHSFIDYIVTIEEVNETIAQCDYEQQNIVTDGFFKTRYPSDTITLQKAQEEGNTKYDTNQAYKDYLEAENELKRLSFEEIEPTKESVSNELALEAKEKISAFFPWSQSKLRKAYISDNVNKRYTELHDLWQSKKDEYEITKNKLSSKVEEKKRIADEMLQVKNDFIKQLSKKLYDEKVKAWELEREAFYDSFRQSLQGVIEGDKDYVITAISSLFPNDEIPQEYFVDFAYIEDKGKVMVDLDLPEIEDIPNKKIELTPTGKKSIRIKGQTELRSDYANCVFGLAMYVAHLIFNVSIKIEEIEICGFTQRKISNSAVAMDQYLFVVNFTRGLFSQIDFSILSALQIMDFFKHHFDMTKGFDLKQIDLGTAFSQMESFICTDYNSFLATLSMEKDVQMEFQEQEKTNRYDNSTFVRCDNETPLGTFEKATRFMKNLYDYLAMLSLDSGVNHHAELLNNINLNITNGLFVGVCNLATYRGKLYFCAILDLYRSLEQMRVNVESFQPATYPLILLIIKTYAQKEIQYSMLSEYKSFYHSFIDMIKSMEKRVPVPNHFYLIGEALYDYDADELWYQQYQILMKNHIVLVRETLRERSYRVKYVDNFIQLHMNLLPVKFKKYHSLDEDNYIEEEIQLIDPLFAQIAKYVVAMGIVYQDMIRREFNTSYRRTERILIQLEVYGIVGPKLGYSDRKVLITEEKDLRSILESIFEKKDDFN